MLSSRKPNLLNENIKHIILESLLGHLEDIEAVFVFNGEGIWCGEIIKKYMDVNDKFDYSDFKYVIGDFLLLNHIARLGPLSSICEVYFKSLGSLPDMCIRYQSFHSIRMFLIESSTADGRSPEQVALPILHEFITRRWNFALTEVLEFVFLHRKKRLVDVIGKKPRYYQWVRDVILGNRIYSQLVDDYVLRYSEIHPTVCSFIKNNPELSS